MVCSTRTEHTHTHTPSHTQDSITLHTFPMYIACSIYKHMTSCMQLSHIVCMHIRTHIHTYVSTCVKGVMVGCAQHCPAPSSCPTHLAGRSTAPLSCSVEAVSAAQTPSHHRPPSWPSCPPLLPPGGGHHRFPPAPG